MSQVAKEPRGSNPFRSRFFNAALIRGRRGPERPPCPVVRPSDRDELAAALYQRESSPYERSIDVHMSHLRKKLERGDRALIRTVRGVGYMFAGGSEVAE